MKCPKCGAPLKADTDRCPKCQLPLIPTDRAQITRPMPIWLLLTRVFIVLLGMLATICMFTFAGVRIYYWRDARKVASEYVNHTIEIVTFDNGMAGHAISFFGNDGDTLYIKELRESYMFIGGVARVEFVDSMWFDDDPKDIESAMITLSPVVISSQGDKTKLPVFTMKIPVPEAPIIMVTPTKTRMDVITSLTPVNMNVVYGSQVIINGEDVTDRVDRSGELAININVYPIGDNNISIIVRTPNHKEARRDLVFYRQEMEINLEVAMSMGYTSTLNYMTINGKTDPGAWIEVDTEYDTGSLSVNQETGAFSFKARFSTFGDNLVRFRATQEGKRDSTISFNVKYLPAKAEYSRNAWAMDYKQLRSLYEQWHGRVFLCKGKIVDMYYENESQYAVMDVGKEESQLVILQNESEIGTLNVGGQYALYADVAGRLIYNANYYPYLIARYTQTN